MSDIINSAGFQTPDLWRRNGIPEQTLHQRLASAWMALATVVRAHADTVIFPGAAILFYNLTFYSGLTTFGLRQVQGNRFPALAGLICLGVAVGELLLPLLRRREGCPPWKRSALLFGLVAMLFASPAINAPGLHNFIYNNPLRVASGFALGLSLPPAYHLYFSRFPARHLGLWFGIATAAGVLLWRILSQRAAAMPYMDDGLYHPFQAWIYPVHLTNTVLLAVICLCGLCRPVKPASSPARLVHECLPRPENRRALVTAILAAAALMYLMNGILQVKLFPMLPMSPEFRTNALVGVMAVISAPLAGLWLDRDGGQGLLRILSYCTWFFIIASSLMVISAASPLHTAVQALGVAGWFLCNITFPVFLARLTPNRQSAGRYASIIFCMWMAAILGVDLTERFFRFEAGSAVLAAVVLALLFHGLAARITRLLIPKTAIKNLAENPVVPEASAPIQNGLSNVHDFIADTPLTPREREAAVLLLQRLSTQDIAHAMGISENTAKKHIQNALRKLGAADRHEFILQHVSGTRKTGEYEESVEDHSAG